VTAEAPDRLGAGIYRLLDMLSDQSETIQKALGHVKRSVGLITIMFAVVLTMMIF